MYDILFSELFTFLFQESYCIKFSRVVLVDFKTVIYHWLLKAYLARFVNLLLLSMKSRSKFPCLHQPIKWYTKRIYLSIGLVKTCYLIFFYHQDGFEKKISKQEHAVTVMTNIVHMIISLILHWFHTRSKKNHYQYFIQRLLGFICKYTRRVIVRQVIKYWKYISNTCNILHTP